ncbi:MAG: fasciclin domain-containing protein [Herminiimonas sp.]|nr:fasciclin domain-containing protein [Herminiimonas sp.]
MHPTFGAAAAALILTFIPATSGAADLLDTAITSGNLKTFVAAVKTSGFSESLRSAGPFTVFAPSDEAFSRLPAGTWEALVKDKARLAQVLGYLIIPGKILVADVKPGKTKTLQGAQILLKSDNGRVTADEATVIESDIVADNGVIHAIDTVAMPK